MKKMRFYLVLIAILSLVLVGCGNSDLGVNTVKKETTEVAALKTDQSVLLFSTLSSASVLSSDVASLSSLSDVAPLFGDRNNEEVEIDMEKANAYLLMMENILADGGPIVSSETASDREDYDMMMVITVKDLAGNVSTYTIYYSIVVEEAAPEVAPEESVPSDEVGTEDSTDEVKEPSYRRGWDDHGDAEDEKTAPERDDDDEDHDDHDDRHKEHHDKALDQFKHHEHDDEEAEVEYQINALAVIDGVEYEVLGKKEVETEDEGEEVEIEFLVKLDENNYVRIEQEIEEDEVEYKYVIYKDGRKQTSLSFESEVEDGVTFVKLTTDENGYKATYKFIKGENKTIIKYSGNGYSYTLFVTSMLDEETGELVYEYKVDEKEFNWEFRKGHKKR